MAFSRLRREAEKEQEKRGQVTTPVSAFGRLVQEAAKERGTDIESFMKSRIDRNAISHTTNTPESIRERAIEIALQTGIKEKELNANIKETKRKINQVGYPYGGGGRNKSDNSKSSSYGGGRNKNDSGAHRAAYAELTELEKELEHRQKLADYFTDRNKDTFWGQAESNFDVGQLTELINEAYSNYLWNPTEANRVYAEQLEETLAQYQLHNQSALDDNGAVLPWLTQSAASYLPQLGNQLKVGISGAALGGVAGAGVGSVVPGVGTGVGALWGAKAGYMGGTGVYSFNNMRGAAFRELVKLGVDEETARAAATDEAVVSSLIEMVDAGIDLATLGTARIASTPLRKVARALAAYGINIGSEGLEESAQQAVSIANRDRVSQKEYDPNNDVWGRMTGLGFDAVGTAIDALTGANSEAGKEIAEAGMEGMKIAAMFGGASMVANGAINTMSAVDTGKQIQNADDEVLQTLITAGRSADSKTESYKIATSLLKKQNTGKSISNAEIGWLVQALQNDDIHGQTKHNNAQTEEDAVREMVSAWGDGKTYTLEQLAREPVAEREETTQSDSKKYGELGAKVFEQYVTTAEDREQATRMFDPAYKLGEMNTPRDKALLENKLQESAYEAGRLDAIAKKPQTAQKAVENSRAQEYTGGEQNTQTATKPKKVNTKKSDWAAHDVQWAVPGQKMPIAYSTTATSDTISVLADENPTATISELQGLIHYNPEAKKVLQQYIDAGYGNQVANEWFSYDKSHGYTGSAVDSGVAVNAKEDANHVNNQGSDELPGYQRVDAVRGLQETDGEHMRGVSKRDSEDVSSGRVGPQETVQRGQRDSVQTKQSGETSSSAVRKEQSEVTTKRESSAFRHEEGQVTKAVRDEQAGTNETLRGNHRGEQRRKPTWDSVSRMQKVQEVEAENHDLQYVSGEDSSGNLLGREDLQGDAERVKEVEQKTKLATQENARGNNFSILKGDYKQQAVIKKWTGYGDNGVKVFSKALEQSDADPEVVRKGFQTAYEAGLTGIDRKRVEFTTPLQEQAFMAGRLDYIATEAEDKAHTTTTAGVASGFDATGAPSHVSSTQRRIINDLATALGSRVVIGKSMGNAEINTHGDVVIADDFQISVGERRVGIVYHAAHELGMHRLMQLAPAEGRAFINAMYNHLSVGRPSTMRTLAESKQSSYAEQDVTLATDKAIEEVVANTILSLYKDEVEFGHAIRKIANGSNQQAKRGLNKFREILADIVKKLKEIVAKLAGKDKTEAQQALGEVEHLRKLYENALMAAVEKNKELMAQKNTTRESGFEYAKTTNGLKYSLKMSFAEQVDAALNGKLDRNTAVFVINTPEMLQSLGMKEYPMLITQRHIRDINHPKSQKNSHWHGLSEDIIKKMPDMIENPVMLLESTTAGDVVVVSSVLDGDGFPVIIAIHPDGSGHYARAELASNFVTSMYGKRSFANFVNSAIDDDRVVYVNKKRTRSLYSRVRLQLPKSLDRDGFIKDSIARKEDVVNADTQLSYSLKEKDDLLKENTQLKKVNEALREQFKRTVFARVDKRSLDKFTKQLLKDYQSDADVEEICDALDDLYTYMANGEDGQSAAWNDLQERAYNVAVSVLKEAITVNDEIYRAYKGLRNRLRNYPISIDKRYDNDIQGYESINDFRKANFGMVKIANEGTPVDIVYSDLANTYPEFFDESEYTTQADQLAHIANVLDSLQPYEVNPYSANMSQAATWLASDILERFYELPQAKPTFADKQAEKLTKQVIKDAKKLEKMREEKDAAIKDAKLAGQMAQGRVMAKQLSTAKKLIEEAKANTIKRIEKEKAAKHAAVKKVREHYKAKEKNASENRKARELRAKIMRHAMDLSKNLLRPTDKQHIPQMLRGTVTELLEAINTESNFETVYGTDAMHHRVAPRTVLGAEVTARTKAFEKLQVQLKEIKARGGDGMVFDPSLIGVPEDGIPSKFDAIIAMRDKRIADMNSTELTIIWEVMRAVEKAITTANQTLAKSKYASTVDWATAFKEDTATRRVKRSGKEHYTLDIETPYTFFNHYGQAGLNLYRMLRNAQDHQQLMQSELATKVRSMVSLELHDKLEEETTTFTTDRGDTLVLSKAHIMEMYLLSKREQAYNHLIYGGIIQPEVGKIRRGTSVTLLTENDIAKITSSLTAEESALADKYQNLTNLLAKWGNEASMKAYGYEKFNDPYYWPIRSASEHVQHTVEKNATNRSRSIANMGSAKPLTPNATNTLDLSGIFSTFDNHAADMMDYAAWLLPMEDVNRLFNFTFTNEEGLKTKTMRDILNDYGGAKSDQYWMNLMTDIQNGVNFLADTASEGFVSRMVGNTKRAAVAANLRVVIQQPTAFVRATAVLDPTLMLLHAGNSITVKSMMNGWEKAKKYAPIAARKADGGFEIASNPKQLGELFYRPQTKRRKLWEGMKEGGLFLPGVMDAATWGVLWNASESQIKRNNKSLTPDTDEFYEAVAELFTEVIDQTQVVDGVLQRSQAMRSSSSLMKQMTSFTGEPTQAGNMVIRAYDQLRYETDKKKRGEAIKTLSRAIGAYLFTAVINAFAQSLVDAIRDDDDYEEGFWEKVWKAWSGIEGDEETWFDFARNILLASNAVNNLNPLTWIPVMKDVMSLIQGYSVQRMDVASIEDFIDSIGITLKTIAGDGKQTIGYATLKTLLLGGKLAKGFGGYSALRDLEAVVRTVQVDITGDYMALYKTEKLMTKPENNTTAYTDILYLAYTEDKEQFDKLYAQMLKDNKLRTDDKTTADVIAGELKGKLAEDLFELYKNDPKAYEKMYNDLVKRDFLKTGVKSEDPQKDTFVSTEEHIIFAMESLMKKEQGVDSVDDLESRYLGPDQQREYDRTMREIKSNSLWRSATTEQRNKLKANLRSIVLESDEDMLEALAGGAVYGLDKGEYLLYKLALEMVDQPSENGKYGSYTNAEKAKAFFYAGLSSSEIAYLWGTDEALDAFGFGIDMEKYLAFKGAIGSIEADKDRRGNSISGSRKRKIEDFLQQLKVNRKEYLFLMGTVSDTVKDSGEYKKYFG